MATPRATNNCVFIIRDEVEKEKNNIIIPAFMKPAWIEVEYKKVYIFRPTETFCFEFGIDRSQRGDCIHVVTLTTFWI